MTSLAATTSYVVLVQSSFQTTWASLFEMELEPNLLDWNVNELECKLELEDMKRTHVGYIFFLRSFQLKALIKNLELLITSFYSKKQILIGC